MEHLSTQNAHVQPGWIAQCEQEPLHLSSAIQPHGALIGLASDGRVVHISSNAMDMLEAATQIQLGDPAPEWLTRLVSNSLPAKPGSRLVFDRALPGNQERVLDIVTSRADDGGIFLEFFPTDDKRNPISEIGSSSFSYGGHPGC